jgi:hypothetical protein
VSERDRETILARRAAFLGSALALLGCARPPPIEEPEPVVSVPEPPAEEARSLEELPGRDTTSEPEAKHPSLEIPEGISEAARRRFEHLAGTMREAYELLDRMKVPSDCDLADAACDGRWRELADQLVLVGEKLKNLRPRCPGTSEHAKLYAARETEHREHSEALTREIEQEAERTLAPAGPAAQQRWELHRRQARLARPRVCLSFMCQDW